MNGVRLWNLHLLDMVGGLRHPIDARLGVVARLRGVVRLGVADHPEADELQGDAFRLEASSATRNFTHVHALL